MDDYRRFDNREFDTDTGTYMEDVHSNDLIGLDKDSDGLIDNVEELIEDADERAKEYNAELERRVREEREFEAREDESEQESKNEYEIGAAK